MLHSPRAYAVGLRAGTDGAPYRHSVVRTPPVDMRPVSLDESAHARVWATVSGDLVVESAWARCRCCHRSVSAGRSLNPPCVFPWNGLSTVSSVRWGAPPSRDWGLCCPCSGKRLMRTEARLYSSIPSAVGAGVVSTDVAPSPAVQFPKPTNHPVPQEVFQRAHGVLTPLSWDDPPN